MLRRKLKQLLSFSLAAATAISLTACAGSNSASSSPTGESASASAASESGALKAEPGATIEFTYFNASDSDKAGWDAMFSGFRTDHPEITLNTQVYPSSTYRDQLDTRIAAKDWPDVIRYTYQRMGKFKENGVMLDLTGKISQESLDDLVPAYLSAMTYNGKLVGMPHHTDTIAVIYNKEMFAKSGVRIPTSVADGWSWDELTTIAKKLKADNNLQYAFAGIWENGSAYRYLPFVYMNGGAVLNDDGTQVTMNTPQALAAIQLLATWRKEGLVSPSGFTHPDTANSLLAAKKIAFVFAGSWQCSTQQQNMGDNWGVTYMPQVNGKTSSDMGGNGLFAYTGTKYPNACAIFIDYLTNKAGMKKYCETSNYIPVRKSLLSEGLTYKNFPDQMKIFLNIVGTIDSKQAKDETSTRFQQLNEVLNKDMDPLIINSSKTPEQVVSDLQADMTAVLKQ